MIDEIDYDDIEPASLDACPRCGRDYDEIDIDYQICHHCGYDAEKGGKL